MAISLEFAGIFFDACGVELEQLAGEAKKFPRRQLVVKKWKIGNVSHPPPRFERLGLDIEAADSRRAGRGFNQASQQFYRGRLARRIRPEHGKKFAARDFERDIVDGDEVAEIFYKVAEFNHGLPHSSMRALTLPGSSTRKISPRVLMSIRTVWPRKLVSMR